MAAKPGAWPPPNTHCCGGWQCRMMPARPTQRSSPVTRVDKGYATAPPPSPSGAQLLPWGAAPSHAELCRAVPSDATTQSRHCPSRHCLRQLLPSATAQRCPPAPWGLCSCAVAGTGHRCHASWDWSVPTPSPLQGPQDLLAVGCLANLHEGSVRPPHPDTAGPPSAADISAAPHQPLPAGLLIAAGGGINDLNPFFMIDPSKDHKAPPPPSHFCPFSGPHPLGKAPGSVIWVPVRRCLVPATALRGT